MRSPPRFDSADDVPFILPSSLPLLPLCATHTTSEALSEAPAFPSQQLASLVASKVYYHLGSTDEALRFALGAGKLFDVELTGEEMASEAQYVETVVCALSFPSVDGEERVRGSERSEKSSWQNAVEEERDGLLQGVADQPSPL